MEHAHSSQFAAQDTQSASLAEILGAFSHALDVTEGQPAGHSVRACWIGMRVGQAIGLGEGELRELFYAVLLKDLGCSSNAARVSTLFAGDDRQLKHTFKLIGPNLQDFGAFVMADAGGQATQEEGGKAAIVDHLLGNAGEIMVGLIDTRCTRGADIARRLRFSEGVALAIAGLDEHWDGSGLPIGIRAEAIPLGSRIALLAQVAEVFYSHGGAAHSRAEIEQRSGGWFDPALVASFLRLSAQADFWDELGDKNLDRRLYAMEPALHACGVDEDYLDDIAAGFGHVIDAKSPYTGGHSERVGQIADGVAERMGFSRDQRRGLRRAAMLHDVGKLGVSSRILEKPGKLDPAEWTAMQSHAGLTTDILGRIGVLRDMAMIAGSHHERLDGKGYPLGLDARLIALETRIITVADFYDALTADRPYRAAMDTDAAMAIMAQEAGAAIDPQCFDALQAYVADGPAIGPLPSIATLPN